MPQWLRQPCTTARVRSFSAFAARSDHARPSRVSRCSVSQSKESFETPLLPPYPYGPARVFKRSDRGLYGGLKVRYGNNVGEKTKKKTRRRWLPNVVSQSFYSKALNAQIKFRVSWKVIRTIDKVGGLDEYLMGGKSKRIKDLGITGWRLRWVLMQTPTYRSRYLKEKSLLPRCDRHEDDIRLPMPPGQDGKPEEILKDNEHRQELSAGGVLSSDLSTGGDVANASAEQTPSPRELERNAANIRRSNTTTEEDVVHSLPESQPKAKRYESPAEFFKAINFGKMVNDAESEFRAKFPEITTRAERAARGKRAGPLKRGARRKWAAACRKRAASKRAFKRAIKRGAIKWAGSKRSARREETGQAAGDESSGKKPNTLHFLEDHDVASIERYNEFRALQDEEKARKEELEEQGKAARDENERRQKLKEKPIPKIGLRQQVEVHRRRQVELRSDILRNILAYRSTLPESSVELR